MYTVIGSPKSRAFRVMWMLEELGQDYAHIPAGPRSDEVTAHNPSGKIPVLLDGEAAITDSVAIITYLADKHGALSEAAGTVARARQDGWTNLVLDEVDALLWTAARHGFILPEEQRVAAIKPSLKWEFARNLDRIAERLGDQPYLMGDQMSVPDILLSHCLGWAQVAKFDPPNARLQRYHNDTRTRPAFTRALERSAQSS